MCGIAGIYSGRFLSDISPMDEVGRMQKKINHRGPDDKSIKEYVHGHNLLTIGFNRLSIIDKSHQANHPQKSGPWRVWLNGEIYNYQELQSQTDHCFLTSGDTEVVAALINKIGIYKTVPLLNGMFVIVAYNVESGEIFIARDRYGIKPIYYYRSGQEIVFASEIKAILSYSRYKTEPNADGIGQWLSFQNIFDHDTLFRSIKRLEKGTIWDLRSDSKTKYWQWNFNDSVRMEYSDAVEKVRSLAQQAVQRQSGQNPVSWLSAGVDSSIISAAAKVPALTCGFHHQQFDESDQARMISKKFNIPHLIDILTEQEMKECLFDTIYHLEDLRVGPCHVNYNLYGWTKKISKVCLQGSGADELFGGYYWRYMAKNYNSIVNRTGIGHKYDFSDITDIYDRYKFDAENFLENILVVSDKLSMAHSIEDRVPFLDNDLVDFATRLPWEWKQNKKILKDAFEGIIPDTILNRKKTGFTSPESVFYYQPEIKRWLMDTIKGSDTIDQYISKKQIGSFFEQKNTPAIWCVLSLSVWLQIFIEKTKP